MHSNDICHFFGYEQLLIFVLQVGFIERTVGRESRFWLGVFLQEVALSISRRREFVCFISEHTEFLTLCGEKVLLSFIFIAVLEFCNINLRLFLTLAQLHYYRSNRHRTRH